MKSQHFPGAALPADQIAERFWSVVRAHLQAAFPVLASDGLRVEPGQKHGRRARFGLVLLQYHLVRRLHLGGPTNLVKWLKDISHCCRETVVCRVPLPKRVSRYFHGRTHPTDTALVTLAKLGRALPESLPALGGSPVVRKALRQHRSDMTRAVFHRQYGWEDPTRSGRTALAQAVARDVAWTTVGSRWGSPRLHDMSSASATASRRKGGLASGLSPGFADCEEVGSLPWATDWSLVREWERSARAGLEALCNWEITRSPEGIRLEDGSLCFRDLTLVRNLDTGSTWACPYAEYTMLCGMVQGGQDPTLVQCPLSDHWYRVDTRGEDLVDFFKSLKGRLPEARVAVVKERGWKCRVVTSLETDVVTSGHALRDILWPVLEDDPVFDLTGDPRIDGMTVEDGEVVLSADLSRATDVVPIGLAITVIDRMVETAGLPPVCRRLARASFRSYRVRYPDGSYVRSTSGWLMGHPATWTILCLVHRAIARMAGFEKFRIRGDDLIAVGPRESVEEYFQLIGSFFQVNRKKSFVSATGGVFAEDTFVVRGGALRLVQHAAPPRGWLAGDKSSLAGAYAQWEKLSPRYARAYRASLLSSGKEIVRKLRKHRIPLHLPRVLGGAGLPHPRGVGGSVAGSVLVSKMVTGAGAPNTAWVNRLAFRQRAALIAQAKEVNSLHGEGSLGSCVPLTEELTNHITMVSNIAMGCTWPEGWGDLSLLEELSEPSYNSIGRDWALFRASCRGVKPPPHVVGSDWSEQRLSDAIRKTQTEGVYWPYRPAPPITLVPE